MSQKRKIDRRIQRTRALLRGALMQLIVDDDKAYDAITIQDITDTANVARTTFYLHFTDKDDLLFSTMRDIYEELFAGEAGYTHLDDLTVSSPEDCDATDFEHVEQYADFYRIMLSDRGSAAFLARVRDYLAQGILEKNLSLLLPEGQEPMVPLDVMAYAIAGAHIGVIKWWLDHDMPISPREISFQLYSLINRGLFWGLNVDVESV